VPGRLGVIWLIKPLSKGGDMKGDLPPLFGAFPDAMVIVDAEGRILQANAQVMSLFGFGEGKLIGMHIQDLFPGQPVPGSGRWRRRNQCDRCFQLVGSRGDSRRFRAAVAVMPIGTENDAAAVITIRDLTAAQETQFILERGLELLSTVISTG
jgi:PAS domain S-box-containing protein